MRMKQSNYSTSFENQFNIRQYITTEYGNVETVDITPQHLRSPIPILFVPGFRETPELQKACMHELSKKGYRILTLVYNYQLQQKDNIEKFPPTEVQKENIILDILKRKNIKKIDIVTHSLGSITSIITASRSPLLCRNIVLLTPAGLTGNDNILRLAWSFFLFLCHTKSLGVIRNLFRKNKTQVPLYKSMIYALKEGQTMASFSIIPLLKQTRAKGVKIAIIAGEKDNIFPIKKIKKSIDETKVDIFRIKKGGHEIFSIPEEAMDIVDETIQHLNNQNASKIST